MMYVINIVCHYEHVHSMLSKLKHLRFFFNEKCQNLNMHAHSAVRCISIVYPGRSSEHRKDGNRKACSSTETSKTTTPKTTSATSGHKSLMYVQNIDCIIMIIVSPERSSRDSMDLRSSHRIGSASMSAASLEIFLSALYGEQFSTNFPHILYLNMDRVQSFLILFAI